MHSSPNDEDDTVDDNTEEGRLRSDINSSRRSTRGQSRIEFERLAMFFHVPINEAAKGLGVCATVLKKVCRKHGIPRWPHRKIKKLDTMLSMLETAATKNPSNPQHEEEIRRKIDCLMRERMVLMTEGKGVEGSGAIADRAEQKRQNMSISSSARGEHTRKKRKREEELLDEGSVLALPPPPLPSSPPHSSSSFSMLSSMHRGGDNSGINVTLAGFDSLTHNHTFPSLQGLGFSMGGSMGIGLNSGNIMNMGMGINMMGMGGMGMPPHLDLQNHMQSNFLNMPHTSSSPMLHHQPLHKHYRHDDTLSNCDLPMIGLNGGGGGGLSMMGSGGGGGGGGGGDHMFSMGASDVVQQNETHFRLLGVDIPIQGSHNC